MKATNLISGFSGFLEVIYSEIKFIEDKYVLHYE